jgi:hypothetical protein
MGKEMLDGINTRELAFFIPPNMTKPHAAKFKLFQRVASHIESLGSKVIRGDYAAINRLPDHIIPIVGCTPEFKGYIEEWGKRGRKWIYWDRGYMRRIYTTWLPKGFDGGYYRWHINRSQMGKIYDVPDDRWKALQLDDQIKPWNRNGRYIVIADTLPDYWNLFSDADWCRRTVEELKKYTDRKIVIRDKESTRPLYDELKDAHCLVAHGSIAAVESVIMGCPVFVTDISAAKFMGLTDFSKIESPVYPERQAWLNSLAYSQFNERELVDGTLWRLLNAMGPVHAPV